MAALRVQPPAPRSGLTIVTIYAQPQTHRSSHLIRHHRQPLSPLLRIPRLDGPPLRRSSEVPPWMPYPGCPTPLPSLPDHHLLPCPAKQALVQAGLSRYVVPLSHIPFSCSGLHFHWQAANDQPTTALDYDAPYSSYIGLQPRNRNSRPPYFDNRLLFRHISSIAVVFGSAWWLPTILAPPWKCIRILVCMRCC